MPVATVVGGTPKLATIPLIETGSAATLNDMITWPSAMVIIGIQDSRASMSAVTEAPLGTACRHEFVSLIRFARMMIVRASPSDPL
jgi:hypothetical protein